MSDEQRRDDGDEQDQERERAGRRQQPGAPADRQADAAPRDRQARPEADR